MLQVRTIFQDSSTGRNSRIIAGLETVAVSARFSRLRSAVAYASYHGCHDVIAQYSTSVRNWVRIQKQWLISIDFGRTEATALEFLAVLPNSEVRIPDAKDLLRHRLIPTRCFHPKTMIFDCGTHELRPRLPCSSALQTLREVESTPGLNMRPQWCGWSL
jgi:hypothetical protein